MRITLTLEPDAYAVTKAKAAQEKLSLGKAASALILQTVRSAPKTKKRGVFKSAGGRYTSEQVKEALADD